MFDVLCYDRSHERNLRRLYSAEQRIKNHLDVSALTVLLTPEHYQFRLKEARRECEELRELVGTTDSDLQQLVDKYDTWTRAQPEAQRIAALNTHGRYLYMWIHAAITMCRHLCAHPSPLLRGHGSSGLLASQTLWP